ncbi:thymidylate synthase [Halobacillus rhizosphaerae]|uniref:thymidylate synthase n=1 Tax=Halobacillus rhizosphaerae TaxID=3064889 RepID=UPI00398AE2FC
MNQADLQYNQIIFNILQQGMWDTDEQVRTVWKDGTPAHTKSIISQKFRFDNTEVPILTTKRVAWKTAIKELLWIWQMKSNRVQDLRDMRVNIWNEWEQADGTIGKAYGYQLAKKNRVHPLTNEYIDQVDYLLYELKNNRASRRHITTLWNPDDLEDMSLTPCVYETQWYVKQGKLSLEVRCRSNDMALGNPFNIFQYNVLQRMIAQVCGYELGEYIFNIGDAHIYDRHIEPLQQQIFNPSLEAPLLWINPNVKNFYDFTIDDFGLANYKNCGSIKMEVAI